MAQAFARANTSGGAIVNISSVLGIKPQGLPQAAYASSYFTGITVPVDGGLVMP